MAAAALKLAATAPSISGWAVLAIGAVRLALPQRGVRQIDLAVDLKISAAGEGPAIGWLVRKSGASWPVYCLDERFGFEHPAPADRRLCVFFGSGDDVQGILCNHVWSLPSDADLAIEPLPGCATGQRSPATGLAQFMEGVSLVTSATALAAYLAALKETNYGRSR
jgi:hypothetical protein